MVAKRIAIIGGGLSGLAAAHRLVELHSQPDEKPQITLFEAGSRLGGLIETCRRDAYLIEKGADSFITNKPAALDLCRRLGLEERLISTNAAYRGSLVLRKGRPVPVPEGFMLLTPSRIVPILKTPLFSPWGKARLLAEYFVPPRREVGEESLATFVRRRLGQEVLERLVQPLIGGIYTADPEKLSLKATFPRFLEMEQQEGSLIAAARRQRETGTQQSGGARYGLFAGLQNGMGELTAALQQQIEKDVRLCCNTAVQAVHRGSETDDPKSNVGNAHSAFRTANSWNVHLDNGRVEEFDGVILAVPAYRAAALLAEVDDLLAELLRGIPYASSAVVVTGHRESDISHPLNAFGLVIPAVENRRLLAVSFASRKFPGRAPAGHVQLRSFIGGALQPELLEQTDEELLSLVRQELAAMLGIHGHEEFAVITRYQQAMPQYHLGHLERIGRIEEQLAFHRGLALAGNAYHGVGIPDAIASGQRAAEEVFASVVRGG